MVLAIGIHGNDAAGAARGDGRCDARTQGRALAAIPRVAQQADARRRGGARENRVIGGAASVIHQHDGVETLRQQRLDEVRQCLRWPIGRDHYRDTRRARTGQLLIKAWGAARSRESIPGENGYN